MLLAPVEYITTAETAGLHCRLVATFRFFADDFFHGVFNLTLGSVLVLRHGKPFNIVPFRLNVPKTSRGSPFAVSDVEE